MFVKTAPVFFKKHYFSRNGFRITVKNRTESEKCRKDKLHGIKQIIFRIFPHKAITKKPAETRMGKGKGAPEYWVAVVKPGRILFEIDGLDQKEAEEAFSVCSHKLPIKTKIVGRREVGA